MVRILPGFFSLWLAIFLCTTALAERVDSLPSCNDIAHDAATHPFAENYRMATDPEVLCRMGVMEVVEDYESQRSVRVRAVVWNIYKGQMSGSGDDYMKLIAQADLALLQESYLTPFWRSLLEDPASGPNQSTAMSVAANSFFYEDGTPTGVAITSRLPIKEVGFLRSAGREPVSETPKMALYTYVKLGINMPDLLVVNVHMINFTLLEPFRQQLRQIYDLIASYCGPVLLAGDFNTWSSARGTDLTAMTQRLGMQEAKPSTDERWMDLDHIFVRGLRVTNVQLRSDISSSDHWPIQIEFYYDFRVNPQSAFAIASAIEPRVP